MSNVYHDTISADSLSEAKQILISKFKEQKDDTFLDIYTRNKVQYPTYSRKQLIDITMKQMDYKPLIFTDIVALDNVQSSEKEAQEFLSSLTGSQGILYIIPFLQDKDIWYLAYGISK